MLNVWLDDKDATRNLGYSIDGQKKKENCAFKNMRTLHTVATMSKM